jgi:hypothetical protein
MDTGHETGTQGIHKNFGGIPRKKAVTLKKSYNGMTKFEKQNVKT